ncbi:hypothetical protein [Bacillus sp. T33-2]|uniref:hypothetical protein n=1 Tax=Bacillus sp. T33-2 TaxID=2054168 RepID=UPI000C76CADF|nr:hypothetical protein [Bacillus sp. T33-2]PLR94590.1 hypothetical protein CVD19_16585 [Bacillus sp. T33-2]
MKKFIDGIVNSSEIVNTATILSLILAVIFFSYQEIKHRREQRKEILRLKDEITNLVIRNHVNSGVPIAHIDFDTFINGFEKVKNCNINVNAVDIAKMVYARVYENEHITKETRLELLKQIDELISTYEYDLKSGEITKENLISSTLFTRISLIITLITYILITQFAEFTKIKLNINNGITILIIALSIFLLLVIKPILDSKVWTLLEILRKDKVTRNKEILSHGSNNVLIKEYKDNTETNDPILFDDYFEKKDEIRATYEQRILLETILRKLYFKLKNEHTKLPVQRIIHILIENEVISIGFANEIKAVYRASNYVVHEGELPNDIKDYESFIEPMREITNTLYHILKNTPDSKGK